MRKKFSRRCKNGPNTQRIADVLTRRGENCSVSSRTREREELHART
ncbi:MAG TPA: hypothetical protein VEZ47_06845 [Gemmatirosa sp.]|nr:hypothetical protein [Gemmatirosa sp.]